MQNFQYYNPTRIVFGKGQIAQLSSLVPDDATVLMTWGGGSIKRNGVYDQVMQAVKGKNVTEFSGIEPNPRFETCMKAVEIVKSKGVDFLMPVGGGSVFDGTKFIAAAAQYDHGDPWEILQTGGKHVTKALPMGGVLTLPATGSEANGNSVISREETKEKLAFGSQHVFPVFSILDPETTFSLPKNQVRNGVVDAFVHVCEQYMNYPVDARTQDRFAEGLLLTLIEVGSGTIKNPEDYGARANFMYAATLALNTLIGKGVPQDWSTHMIGHELTALYGPAHAETLAIVLFGMWRVQFDKKKEKLAQFGKRVWGVDSAEAAIEKTEAFFHDLEMPTRLSDYGIDAEDAAKRVPERIATRGMTELGENGDVTPDKIAEILRLRA